MSKVKRQRMFTSKFLKTMKKMEERENVPESPTVVTKEKDESDLQVKEKSQDSAMKRTRETAEVKMYRIRAGLYEDEIVKFKVLCNIMNVSPGVMTARMIKSFIAKNIDKVKTIINENVEE